MDIDSKAEPLTEAQHEYYSPYDHSLHIEALRGELRKGAIVTDHTGYVTCARCKAWIRQSGLYDSWLYDQRTQPKDAFLMSDEEKGVAIDDLNRAIVECSLSLYRIIDAERHPHRIGPRGSGSSRNSLLTRDRLMKLCERYDELTYVPPPQMPELVTMQEDLPEEAIAEMRKIFGLSK